ncbi:MAG: hypothetical protein MJ211_05950 [Bacteroidales bacterium]|nr:hypothetical protein [Bacteroidales bacterium]
MNKNYILIVALALLFSACNKKQAKQSNKTALKTTMSTMKISNIETNNIDEEDYVDTILNYTDNFAENIPEAISKYDIYFWNTDSAVIDNSEDKLTEISNNNQNNAAIQTGANFATAFSLKNDSLSEKVINNLSKFGKKINFKVDTLFHRHLDSVFIKTIYENENNGNSSIAAMMMAGNYFKMLQHCAKNNLNDIKLQRGIEHINHLTDYINNALQSTEDLKTNIYLQKLKTTADSCKILYQQCNENYNGEGIKYQPLIDLIDNTLNGELE